MTGGRDLEGRPGQSAGPAGLGGAVRRGGQRDRRGGQEVGPALLFRGPRAPFDVPLTPSAPSPSVPGASSSTSEGRALGWCWPDSAGCWNLVLPDRRVVCDWKRFHGFPLAGPAGGVFPLRQDRVQPSIYSRFRLPVQIKRAGCAPSSR